MVITGECQVKVHHQYHTASEQKRVVCTSRHHQSPAVGCHEIICVYLRKHTAIDLSDKLHKLQKTMNACQRLQPIKDQQSCQHSSCLSWTRCCNLVADDSSQCYIMYGIGGDCYLPLQMLI